MEQQADTPLFKNRVAEEVAKLFRACHELYKLKPRTGDWAFFDRLDQWDLHLGKMLSRRPITMSEIQAVCASARAGFEKMLLK